MLRLLSGAAARVKQDGEEAAIARRRDGVGGEGSSMDGGRTPEDEFSAKMMLFCDEIVKIFLSICERIDKNDTRTMLKSHRSLIVP